jgi:hypothetical protein
MSLYIVPRQGLRTRMTSWPPELGSRDRTTDLRQPPLDREMCVGPPVFLCCCLCARPWGPEFF